MVSSLRNDFFLSSGSSPEEANPPSLDKTARAEDVPRSDLKASSTAEHETTAERPNDEAQAGVTQAEAITLTWTKASLGLGYIL